MRTEEGAGEVRGAPPTHTGEVDRRPTSLPTADD